MNRIILSAVAISVVLVSAPSASAQTPQESRPERPYRGLYGGGTDQSQQVLSVNGSAGAGYDTNASANQSEAGLLAQPTTSADGSAFGSLSGGLSYSGDFSSATVGASMSSSARYYADQATTLTTSHAGSAGLNLELGRKTKASGSASVSYQPFRSFVPFSALFDPALGQVVAPDQTYGGGRDSYYTYTATASLTRQLSTRASLSASYDRYLSDGSGNSGRGLNRQTGSVLFTRSLTRRLGLRLGYGYTDATFASDGRQYGNHNFDTGVDYSRDFSLTRRTKLAFSSGGAAVMQEGYTRYDVTGNASLTREIGRTWDAAINYQRRVGFIESLREPAFYDGVSAGLHGLINRRVSFHSDLGVIIGTVGVTPAARQAGGFDSWNASSGVNTALTRHLSLGINYSYYRYAFDSRALIASDLLPRVGRHSVVASLNAWAPVFQHGRKSNASR
jgi:hypothetical protein